MSTISLLMATGAILVSGLAACAPKYQSMPYERPGATSDTVLVGTSWSLATMDATNVEGDYTLTFSSNGKVSGQADCNRFFGSFTSGEEEGALEIGQLGSTKVMCPPESLEGRYLESLQSTVRVHIEGESLTLITSDGTELTFRATEHPEGHDDGVPSGPNTTDFRASGTEPFWSLEIREAEGATFSRPGLDGIDSFSLPYSPPSLGIETGERFFHLRSEDHEIQAIFAPKPCVDAMNGQGFEFTVTVRLNGEDLFGCGSALAEEGEE